LLQKSCSGVSEQNIVWVLRLVLKRLSRYFLWVEKARKLRADSRVFKAAKISSAFYAYPSKVVATG